MPRLPQALAMRLNSYKREHKAVRVQCLLSDQDIAAAITGARLSAGLEVAERSKDAYGSFSHRTYSLANEDGEGALHLVQQDSRVCLLSGESGGFFHNVEHIIGRLRPRPVVPFVNSSEIRHILEEFEKHVGTSLLHRTSVRRRMFGDMPKTYMEWDKSAPDRLHQSVAEAYEKASKDDLTIDSIRAFSSGPEGFDMTVSRTGKVTVYVGGMREVYDGILQPIMDAAATRKKRFAHRSRSERRDKEPKPLLIKYKSDVFADKKNRERFCNIIDDYIDCNYSIVHAGNPHIYISILDKRDNSSLSVRSIGNNSLAIIPQIRTTEASLMRLTGFLASTFLEGVISDYEF